VIVRDSGIVYPKYGSILNSCSDDCNNGLAAGSTLQSIEITVEDGQVYPIDDDTTYLHEGHGTCQIGTCNCLCNS